MPADRRRVLILAYYFPPLGMSGVQRVSKFVKYLPEFGWDVTVIAPQPAGYFAFDESLLADVTRPEVTIVRTRSLDPTRIVGRSAPIGLPSESLFSMWSKVNQFLFVPDNKLGWRGFAIGAGLRALGNQRHDVILSSAPPYTAHLAATHLSRVSGLPHVADFRDDWVGNPRHNYPTSFHHRRHVQLESRVLKQVDTVITINSVIAQHLRERGGPDCAPIEVISQGFDPDDIMARTVVKGKCTFLYSGVFYDAQRPDTFLRALALFLSREPSARKDVVAQFVGLLPEAGIQLAADLNLGEVVAPMGYRTHRKACEQLANADVLWLTVGRQRGEEQISTGKLFEYLGTRKPILGLVPPGAAHDVLARYSAASIVDPDDVEGVAKCIERLFHQWKRSALPEADAKEVERYNRKKLALDLGQVLELACERNAN